MAMMVTRRGSSDFAATVERLRGGITARGLKIFASVDHAAAAADVGMDLAPEEVILFGSPKAGTPLMRSDPRVGVELPLRILIWQDSEGAVLGYQDPRELAAPYELSGHEAALDAMEDLLDKLVGEAAG